MSTSWPLQKTLVRIDPYAEENNIFDSNVTVDQKLSRIRGLVSSQTVHLFCVVNATHNNYQKQNGKENYLFHQETVGGGIAPLLEQSSAVSILRFMVTLSFNDKQATLTWNACFRLLGKFCESRTLMKHQTF